MVVYHAQRIFPILDGDHLQEGHYANACSKGHDYDLVEREDTAMDIRAPHVEVM